MATEEEKKANALEVYRKRLLEHRESEAKVKSLRDGLKQLKKGLREN